MGEAVAEGMVKRVLLVEEVVRVVGFEVGVSEDDDDDDDELEEVDDLEVDWADEVVELEELEELEELDLDVIDEEEELDDVDEVDEVEELVETTPALYTFIWLLPPQYSKLLPKHVRVQPKALGVASVASELPQ